MIRRLGSALVLLAVASGLGRAQNITQANIQCLGGMAVNSYTGNLWYQRTELYLPGRGLSIDLTFSYNSAVTAKDFGYGPGWTHSYNLLYERSGSNVAIRREDGRRDLFLYTGSPYYTAPAGVFDVLNEFAPGRFRLARPDGIAYSFEDSTHKRLTSITDPNGNQVAITYAAGVPSAITDPSGRRLSLSWSGGRLLQVRDSTDLAPRSISYQYDADGNPTRVTDAMSQTTQYAYDARSRLTSVTDPHGTTFTLTYDDSGAVVGVASPPTSQSIAYDRASRITTATEPYEGGTRSTIYAYDGSGRVTRITGSCCGYDMQFEYDSQSNLTRRTDANGRAITFTYDTRGNRLSETDPLGGVSRWTYEPTFNKVESAIDKRGNMTGYAYDAAGNLIRVNRPLGITELFTYDASGNQLSTRDGNGNTTSHTYDGNGHRLTTLHPDGASESYEYDAHGNRTRWTDARGNVTRYTYDALNRLVSVTNAVGDSIRYTYDASGNRTSIFDERGNVSTFAYDALNRRVSSTTPAGTTTYAYDEGGNRVAVTDGNGNVTRTRHDPRNLPVEITDALNHTSTRTYDAAGNLVTRIDFNGNTTAHAYDALNRLVRVDEPLGRTTLYTYDANGNLTGTTDPRGGVTTHTYDALNRITQTRDALGGTVTSSYDWNGNVVLRTDENGRSTHYRYGSRNRLVSVRNPAGDSTTFSYDAASNRTSARSELGHTTLYTYDALNRLVAETSPLGEVTRHVYDAAGNRTATITPDGNTTSYVYDAANRLVSTSDLAGPVSASTYDANSNLVASTDGLGHTTSMTFDALNRLIRKTLPLGQVTEHAYDANGNLISVRDANGNTTTHVYDALNRRIESIDHLGSTTTTTYDVMGNVLERTDERGNVTAHTYDALNRLVRETLPDATFRAFTYDAGGNLSSRRDNNGAVTSYTYDVLDRVAARTFPGGNEQFTYDAAGRLTGATNAAAAVTYTYDAQSRLLSETLNGKVTAYSYDTPARTRSIVYPGGRTLVETRDVRRRLVQIEEGMTVLASYTYDAANRTVRRTYANGALADHTYDDNHRLQDVAHSLGATTLAAFTQTFDAVGNRLSAASTHRPAASETYAYDTGYRLDRFKRGVLAGDFIPSPSLDHAFSYDPAGNRTVVTRGATTTTYTSNDLNQYTSIIESMTSTPIHDANGNLTSDGVRTFQYDFENRLISVLSTATYRYDAVGRRIQKTAGGMTTNYYYAWNRVIEDRDAADAVVATYAYGSGIDEVLSMTRSGAGTFWYHENSLGSMVAISDAAAAVVERYEYDAYGRPTIYDGSYHPLAGSAVGNRHLFTGREYEPETGLYHYRARAYDPIHGRFLQRDPLGTVDGMNLYVYVRNNPVNAVDPSGLQCKKKGICGPDITKSLENVYQQIKDYYESKSRWVPRGVAIISPALALLPLGADRWEDSKDYFCNTLDGIGMWDIRQLLGYKGGGVGGVGSQAVKCASNYAEPRRQGRPFLRTREQCENTVTVHGECFYAGTANYALFGYIHKVCDKAGWWFYVGRTKISLQISAYKGPLGEVIGQNAARNFMDSIKMAEAAFDSDDNGAMQVPPGDRTAICDPCNGEVYNGNFSGVWGRDSQGADNW